jgi:hypothetical protein
MRFILFLATLCGIIPTICCAITVDAYHQAAAKDPALATTYIKGAGDALTVANAELEYLHQEPLFCTPPTLALHTENYTELLDTELTANKKLYEKAGTPVEYALLTALKKTFPCKHK